MARTKSEIIAELEQWRSRKIMNSMSDRFTDEERKFDEACSIMIQKLQKELKEVEENE